MQRTRTVKYQVLKGYIIEDQGGLFFVAFELRAGEKDYSNL